MASLLDEVLGQSGWDPTPLLQPPDERPPSLRPDPRADALGQTWKDITDYMAQQHQKGVDEGYWTGGGLLEGGHPTLKAFNSAADEYARGMQAGTLKGPGPFTTYQGSPHKFAPTPKNPLGEFSNERIGSGTGGQSEGMGHYTAENEGVGQYYRKLLSGPRADYAGEIAPEFRAALKTDDYLGFDSPGQAIRAMEENPDWARRWDVTDHETLKSLFNAHQRTKYADQGHMYEVKINADPDRYVSWDKPLSQQHPDVRAALRPLMSRDQYRDMTEGAWKDAAVSKALPGLKLRETAERLNAAGIPGIRYLDAGSRGEGEGTHNYVTFDPAKMEIIRRYGLAGLMLGGGGLLSPDKQEQ
jgi:hypothetical protein